MFTRYTTSTNYKVSFADLASSFTAFTTTPPTIHVSVNDGAYATYHEGDVVSLPEKQTTHTVCYYEGDNENVSYTMRVMVDSSTNVSVIASEFDLSGRDYISLPPRRY